MDHQKDALGYAEREPNPAFFMDMRLGKTYTTIEWVKSLSEIERVLVGAPSWVLPSWMRELQTEGLEYVKVQGSKHSRSILLQNLFQNHPSQLWYLTNYELLQHEIQFSLNRWDVVILDESTRIKNPQAKTTKLLCGDPVELFGVKKFRSRFRDSRHRAILSGLPAPEGCLELYTQFYFLDGHMMGYPNFWAFRNALFHPGRFKSEWIPNLDTERRIKEYMHQRAFCLTREEVGLGSRAVYETAYTELPNVLKKEYKKAEREFCLLGEETKWQLVLDNWLSRLSGGFSPDGTLVSTHKIDLLLELLSGPLSGEPVIVWYKYNAELEACYERLSQAGFRARRVRGGLRPEDRNDVERSFRDGEADILLCQVKCGRYGMDLSRSSTAIYYSCTFSCDDRQQSEERIIHPMKTEPVLYIDLVTEGTIDEDLVDGLKIKDIDSKGLMRYIKLRTQERTHR